MTRVANCLNEGGSAEFGEYVHGPHTGTSLDTSIQVGHQRYCRITDFPSSRASTASDSPSC